MNCTGAPNVSVKHHEKGVAGSRSTEAAASAAAIGVVIGEAIAAGADRAWGGKTVRHKACAGNRAQRLTQPYPAFSSVQQ
jgi:hypothetical protein